MFNHKIAFGNSKHYRIFFCNFQQFKIVARVSLRSINFSKLRKIFPLKFKLFHVFWNVKLIGDIAVVIDHLLYMIRVFAINCFFILYKWIAESVFRESREITFSKKSIQSNLDCIFWIMFLNYKDTVTN